jgi:hypothetical protein
LALEDFLFFSLYSFSGIAKQVTTLKQLRLVSFLDSLETDLESLAPSPIHYLLPISPKRDPACYNMFLDSDDWQDFEHFVRTESCQGVCFRKAYSDIDVQC